MPERIAGLVLGNTEIPGHHPWRLKCLLAAARNRFTRSMMPALMRSRGGRWLLLRDCVGDTSLIERELTPRFIMPLSDSPQLMAGAMSMADGLAVTDFDRIGDAHPLITAPVHLVWGADDPWFPLSEARAMMPTFGGKCTLVAIEGGKLLVHEEAPGRFAAEIRAHFTACFQCLFFSITP
jgi:pimeloyl-ACP methyl ester carboxylesterase